MREITLQDGAEWARLLLERGLTAGTYNATIGLLRRTWKVLCPESENPFGGVPRSKLTYRSRVPFTDEELSRLIECCTPHIRGAVITAACTGLRRCDACRLEWSRVDLSSRMLKGIRVAKTGIVVDIPMVTALYDAVRSTPVSGPFVWPEAAEMAAHTPRKLDLWMHKALRQGRHREAPQGPLPQKRGWSPAPSIPARMARTQNHIHYACAQLWNVDRAPAEDCRKLNPRGCPTALLPAGPADYRGRTSGRHGIMGAQKRPPEKIE